jgi:hypothetical protein
VKNHNQTAWRSSGRLPNEKQIPTLTETPLQNGSHRQPLQPTKNDFAVYDFVNRVASTDQTCCESQKGNCLKPGSNIAKI